MTALTTDEIRTVARSLIAARSAGEALAQLTPSPTTESDGYLIQDATIELNPNKVVGWKVGATSTFAMELFKTNEPFAGPVFDGTLFHGTADTSVFRAPAVEGEFAFVLASDLPARGELYSRPEVEAAIGDVHGAIELVDTRVEGFPLPLPVMLADCSGNGGLVVGAGSGDRSALDLLTTKASMTITGEVTGSGVGADAYGDPVDSLVWLVNHLSVRGHDLLAGMVVTTGSCTGIAPLSAGASATADFGALGQVSATN